MPRAYSYQDGYDKRTRTATETGEPAERRIVTIWRGGVRRDGERDRGKDGERSKEGKGERREGGWVIVEYILLPRDCSSHDGYN